MNTSQYNNKKIYIVIITNVSNIKENRMVKGTIGLILGNTLKIPIASFSFSLVKVGIPLVTAQF